MKTLNLILTAALLVPNLSFALSAEDNYPLFCGDRAAFLEAAKQSGEDVSKVTEADFAEANKSRKPLFTVLNKGAAGVKELIEEGSKSDTGSLGAVITCGMIVQIKESIAKDGCFDLQTNKAVFDKKGGIAACEQVLKKIQEQTKKN